MPKSSPRRRKAASKTASKSPFATASKADRHQLYEMSVQTPKSEVKFLRRIYKSYFGREPLTLREDFCGTAQMAKTWVQSHKDRTALGIDIEPEVLAWGHKHNIEPLGEDAHRLKTICSDVMNAPKKAFDIIAALNYSYWVFKTRDLMRDYFKTVRKSVGPETLYFLDLYGGWGSYEPQLEKRAIKGCRVRYVWDQEKFDPITHEALNHIHYEFPDGTKMKKAFTYDWRLWTIPEIVEILGEAGFKDVKVYWDVSPDDIHEVYRVRQHADNLPSFLAYVIAR